MKHIKLPAIFDRYNRKKDRSYSVTFVTSLEVPKEQREAIDEMWQNEGWLLFVPNEEESIEIPTEKAETGMKSSVQVLLGRMFVAWKHRTEKGKTTQTFDEFRRSQLEGIGQQYLDEVRD
jgi:hypothetical protein